jgi:DNA-binding response OmpR family regulator
MKPAAKIIVVEDDALTRASVARFLKSEGHYVREASDTAACRAAMRAEPPDVVVLDLGLPGADGLTLAEELRGADIDIIVVTARAGTDDKVAALDRGVDDYLVKPIQLQELAARIRARLRRRTGNENVLCFGRWRIDLVRRTFGDADGEAVVLTRGEFDLLAQLVKAEGKIVSREALARSVTRSDSDKDPRSVDALISRLRRKLKGDGRDVIVTAPGFGYRLKQER